MSNVTLTVNGRSVSREVEDRTLLVQLLRDHLGLTGTHVGCDTSQCGACVVHLDGVAVKSCTVLAAAANGTTVLTIEGLAKGDQLHPVQAAFREHHGLQCGFCTPGMIMSAVDMIRRYDGTARREDGAPRARRQHLPLHRLPQHRQGHPRRRAGDARRRARGRGVGRPATRSEKMAAERSSCPGLTRASIP